jgi:uncharacterized protein (DUF427 family)
MSNCEVIRSNLAELLWIQLMECQNVKSTIYSLKSLMPKAIWNGTVLAQSDNTIVVEGNHYFPPESINQEYFQESNTHTTCPWKGVASYYSIEVDGQTNKDAAWYYPSTKEKAKHFQGYVAFWKGVKVEA